MKLTLRSEEFMPNCTIGRLYVDDEFECFTLEDTVREVKGEPVPHWKIPAKTAIPSGEYAVTVTMSARFKKRLPLLLDVPGFSGVRIHPGNTDADTEGCILVGEGKRDYAIVNSRVAFQKLLAKIEQAIGRKEPVTIAIERNRP